MVEKSKVYPELDTLVKIQNERNKNHIEWIKKILSISTSFTAIIISFKSGKSENCIQLYSYFITIFSSGIGILFGLIHLYSYIVLDNRTLTKAKTNILLLLNGKDIDKLNQVSPPFYHIASEKICIVFLLISFLSLITYGISIEI